MEGGRELYYTDASGRKQDSSLWEEILGKDDQDIIQINDLPGAVEETESGADVPLGKVPFTR